MFGDSPTTFNPAGLTRPRLLTMTSQESPDLTSQIAEWQSRLVYPSGQSGLAPGPLLASCLARVLDPSRVIFSDWGSVEGSHYELTSGSLFALIPGFAVKVEWLNLPRGRDTFRRREDHSVDITFHPLAELPTARLHFDAGFSEASTDPDAVCLKGAGWSQALPFQRRYQPASDYFREVWSAAQASVVPSDIGSAE
jgi:hypothetical protein